MRRSSSPPSLVPEYDVTVHVVLDDFGKSGRAYREVDEQDAGFDTVVTDIISGQYDNPVRIVAFNTSEGWARDVTEDVARAVVDKAHREDITLTGPALMLARHYTDAEIAA